MANKDSNKAIAVNTVMLYFRMMLTMIISLYTSRVILETLGVDDYGLYQAVGGIVGLLSFINGALATGSSRFLTYELGTGNFEKLKKTFSSVLTVHIILAIFIALIAETVGLWFLYNKMVIPAERLSSAVWVFHISIITALVTITQVPYNASIISHERMGIYAYVSIIEGILKLAIVYLLCIGQVDKLVLYAILLCLVQVGIALFYRYYCVRNFSETHYYFVWDRPIIKEVLGYSGWNLIANTAHALNNQGATILINLFFPASVVTARSVANQVNMAANQFISNFRTAANPQIVKKYAAGDYQGSQKLLLMSTQLSYYMMLVLCVPICFVADTLLDLWLTEVPDYSVEFLQLTIVTSLFQVFDTSFYTALYAKGRIKENALLCPTMGLLVFPIVYILFKIGMSPLCLAWALMAHYAINGLLIKPILIIRIVDYKWGDIIRLYYTCIKVTVVSVVSSFVIFKWFSLNPDEITKSFLFVIASVCIIVATIWIIGIDRPIKKKIIKFAKIKILGHE